MDATVTNVSLGRLWLHQMGTGSMKSGVTIQYCMATPRHALTSLEIPAVTNVSLSRQYRYCIVQSHHTLACQEIPVVTSLSIQYWYRIVQSHHALTSLEIPAVTNVSLGIQYRYCIVQSHNALTSLEIPAVTNVLVYSTGTVLYSLTMLSPVWKSQLLLM